MTQYRLSGPPRFAHQKRGLQKLISTRGVCALLFDPGTGKTATALDYMGLLALKAPTGEARVLVIAPLIAVDTWVLQARTYLSPQIGFWAEAIGGSIRQKAVTLASRGPQEPDRTVGLRRSFAVDSTAPEGSQGGPAAVPGPRLVLEVCNLEAFSRRDRVGSRTIADVMLDAVKAYQPDLILVDESHKIGSASSNVSRLLARVGKVARRRVILTGTVMPSGPLNVYGQWRFLEPGAFADEHGKPLSFGRFQERYAVMGGWMGKEVKGYRYLDEMQDIMARNALVVRKEDALDLPAVTDALVPFELAPAERRAYDAMKSKVAQAVVNGTASTASSRLTQMLRLRQITAGHLPDDNGNVQVVGRSKVAAIRSLVHDTLAGEKRIVVFGVFKHELTALADALAEKGTEVLVIDGDTPVADRARMRARFASEDPARLVIVAQIATMSLAVNELVAASHAVFATLTQQRADWVQARDRLDRIGQTRPVTFWTVVARGTVDEVVLTSHREKSDLEAAMLRHIGVDSPE